MSTLEILNSYVDMLIVATLIAFVLIAAATYYMLKVKKVTAKEERINYDTFSRRDAKEFVKFDNVLSCSTGNEDSSFGIVVVNKNTFLGALDVTGYNFNTASDEERVRTMINSVSFFNLVEKPIQLRQTVKAIEIDYNIGKQLEACKELARKSMDLEAEYEDTYALSEQVQDNPEVYEAIAERLDVLQNMIVSVRWQASEANAVLQLMKGFTAGGQAKKVNQLIFSYTYNASD